MMMLPYAWAVYSNINDNNKINMIYNDVGDSLTHKLSCALLRNG